VLAGLDHWRDSGRWRLTLQGNLDRSTGHVPGSGRLGGTVTATATHMLAGGGELGFEGSLGTGRQEEWGAGVPAAGIPAAPAGAERNWLEAVYGVELRGPLGNGFRYLASLRGRHAGLKDEVRGSPGTLSPASTGGELKGEVTWLRRTVRLYLSAGTEGDRSRGPLAERTDRLSTLRIGAEALLGDTSSLRLGAVGFLFDGALGRVTRLWPEAGVTMRYSDRFSMYVQYRPNLSYRSLGEARRENPFVANTYQVVPIEEKVHRGIGLRYTLAPRLSAGFEVARRQFDRLAVWRRAPLTESESDGLFVLDGLASVGLNETRLVLQGPIGDRLEVEAAAVLVDPTGDSVAHLPHIPPWRLEGEARVQGPWRLRTAITVQWLAERFGDTAGSADRSIAGVADLGMRLSWPLKEGADIWLELENLLAQQSALWEGYTLPGRITALGISVRF
jgi:hypothetical protein